MSTKLDQILDLDLPLPSAPISSPIVAPPVCANTVSVQVVPAIVPIDVTADANNTVQQDAQDARSSVRLLLAQGALALNDLLAVARDTKSPRAYEVASNMLKTMSEMNQDLMRVHEHEQMLTGEEKPTSVHIEQAVFVGSTADLGELVKQKRAQRNANTITVQAENVTVVPAQASQPEVLS